jgi:hypothetical protein
VVEAFGGIWIEKVPERSLRQRSARRSAPMVAASASAAR